MRQKIIIGVIGILLLSINQTKAVDVDVYLKIINSFSGTINITGSNIFTKNNIVYTTTTTPIIEITSDEASTYIITGDLTSPISGSQSNPYTLQTNLSLIKTNAINTIFPVFWKELELLRHKTLQVFVDTSAPTIPTIISPSNNANRNGSTIISRTPSTDLGAGLKEYIILISTDQLFSTTLYYQTTTNDEQYINTSTFPSGNLYIKILAKDEIANISESQMITVCNKCATPPSGGGGGGGGFYTPPSEPTDIQRITIIENLEEQQKIEIKEDPKIGFISNILYDEELLDAYKYAYNLGITTMPTAYQANLKGKLVRKDLAKMISEYALKVLKLKPDNRLTCLFDDLEDETLETKYYTKLACKLGLMGRHADGKSKLDNFMPDEAVNRAQFGTVLSRTLFGESHNINKGENFERYQKHLLALNQNNIMKVIDIPWMVELRGRVMLTMMRADPNRTIQHASAK
ncbi:MAG: hypothetical protein PHR61_03235 [Candidatus Absconditabacteria bacterium]|nr:hypothetical protein [Candidatus Absconditabacteria bacterium]